MSSRSDLALEYAARELKFEAPYVERERPGNRCTIVVVRSPEVAAEDTPFLIVDDENVVHPEIAPVGVWFKDAV